ncbi:hypothetical protein AB4Y43_18255 [Paraburkholderia sp. BR10872]|uniref:hypothetical protein n=1 Tax=Paraburkholderia sp. BR10872 TaxID=3236989 RepID=UPI0034D15A05
MTNRNKAENQDTEQNNDALPVMFTVSQLAKANNCSRGLIYKILKSPDGPVCVKLGDKTLVEASDWRAYLKRKTVTRDAIEEEADVA